MCDFKVGDIVRWNTGETEKYEQRVAHERLQQFGDIPLVIYSVHHGRHSCCLGLQHLDGSDLYNAEHHICGDGYSPRVLRFDPFLTAVRKRRK